MKNIQFPKNNISPEVEKRCQQIWNSTFYACPLRFFLNDVCESTSSLVEHPNLATPDLINASLLIVADLLSCLEILDAPGYATLLRKISIDPSDMSLPQAIAFDVLVKVNHRGLN
jgi:hypothetical protein